MPYPRFRLVALAALAFTYLFYAEYLPPFQRVHIPFDLAEYHYSLANYAFLSLKDGRFPQWDPTLYSGSSFVGNIQAALFYPLTWVLFAWNAGRAQLSYLSLQGFVLVHVWIAFLTSYLWLRGRRLQFLAAMLGAGIFAYGGYLCLQLQHLGLVIGFVWLPLALFGIDEANDWRALWKVSVASALCILGGYPPLWLVFAVCTLAYTAGRGVKLFLSVAAALAFSAGLAMAQLIPAWEAYKLVTPVPSYGGGYELSFFLSYLLPNYFNFGMDVPLDTNPFKEYLYLGAPAVFGILALIGKVQIRTILPLLSVGLVCLVLLQNPFGMVWEVIRHLPRLASLCRAWYFLAGITLACSGLAAHGLDAFLTRPSKGAGLIAVFVSIGAPVAWGVWSLVRLQPVSGWMSGVDAAVALGLSCASFFAIRGASGAARKGLIAALLVMTAVDYKTFGTSKRFNAQAGAGTDFPRSTFAGMDSATLHELQAHPEYRVLLDELEPYPPRLRHIALNSPQGYDPMIAAAYQRIIRPSAHFETERLFTFSPQDDSTLNLFGVRYVITHEQSAHYKEIASDPRFRAINRDEYYRVFEKRDAVPAYGWADVRTGDESTLLRWQPEERGFYVKSAQGGLFTLREQLFPGWAATVDGREIAVQRWDEAFLSVQVPAGEHSVDFRFHDPGLIAGALISLASLVGLVGWIRLTPCAWGRST